MQKSDFLLKLTKIALDTLFRLTNAQLRIKGQENIPDQPILYVINHFTRMETFFLPYVIRNITGKDVFSLASSEFFGGGFGNVLQKLGAVPTNAPDRDRVFGSTLLKGDTSCLIFPEGQMIKDKRIIEKGKYMVYNSGIRRPPHTGAGIEALKAEFYREKLKYFFKTGYHQGIDAYEDYFNIDSYSMLEKVLAYETNIVPVNITYFPLRARRNIVNRIAEMLVDEIPQRLEEELEVEGAMVVDGVDIDINFGKPIPVNKYLQNKTYGRMIRSNDLYLKEEEVKKHLHFSREAISLMYRYMNSIYSMTTVNCEHIFAHVLEMYKTDVIDELDYRNRLFLALNEIKKIPLKYNHSLLKLTDDSFLTDVEYVKYNNFIEAVKAENLIRIENGRIIKNSKKFSRLYEFHTIRKDNIVEVLKNEVAPLRRLVNALNRLMIFPDFFVRRMIRNRYLKLDRDIFEADYKKYYIDVESKPKEIGMPCFMKRPFSRKGVLLIHGYMSAPEEMRELADFLYGEGYTVYGTRLRGHGTAPEDLATRKWEEWLESVSRAYIVLRNTVDRVAVVGFSTGAGLAILKAIRRKDDVKCVVSINAPLHLSSIGSHFASVVVGWNHFLEKVHIHRGKMEYVTNQPQNPHINYFRNPVQGVNELEKLMKHVEGRLGDLTAPVLVIQGSNDPVVNPQSGPEIFQKLGSNNKKLCKISADKHVIVRGEYSSEVFKEVKKFLKQNL